MLVDIREPAVNPISFENKSIAIYVSVNEISAETQVNYMQKFYLASGIASKIEEELELSNGAVYIYTHYPARDSALGMEYIQSLSRQADSDIVMLIDSVSVSDSENVGDFTYVANISNYNYVLKWNKSLFKGKIDVYDGTTIDKITQLNLKDTIYWETFSRNRFDSTSVDQQLVGALKIILDEMGRNVGSRFFAQWIPEYRSLFVYYDSAWKSAIRYAKAFEWGKAIEIWMTYLDNEDRYRASCAAINIAVGCEMTDRHELAIEWLEKAGQIYNIPKLDLSVYKARLEEVVRKKMVGL